MKKIKLFLTISLLMVLVSACNKEQITIEENRIGQKITLSASFPGNEPITKVALDQQENNTIALTWAEGDQITLAYVKDQKNTAIETVTIRDISANGKDAKFDITIPEDFDSGTFDLYGVYGGGGISIVDNKPIAILPSTTSDATSLSDIGDASSVQARKDVMLYFASTGINVNAPNASVTFNHLGSLFCINIINDSGTDLQFSKARLIGVDALTNIPLANGEWAYNSLNSSKSYDLISGLYLDQESSNNYISFTPSQTTIPTGNGLPLWAWYPPLPTINWPALRLDLLDSQGATIANTDEPKPARESATPIGKAFYFYAGYFDDGNGGNVVEFLNPMEGRKEYHIENMGQLITEVNEAGDDPAEIIGLKLTGSINNVDFAYMKLQMPNLEFLDIGEVTCFDNKIPETAFGGDSQLNSHTKITEVILPTSITQIGTDAFAYCTNLTSIPSLPDGITSIGDRAFLGCSGLTGNLTWPSNLQTIGHAAFAGCIALNSLSDFPNTLTSIGIAAFHSCFNLASSISFPSSLTSIGESAFNNCSNLIVSNGTLTFPEGLIAIADSTFYNCESMDCAIVLPSTLTSIGASAFENCSSIKNDIIFNTTIANIGSKGFYNCTNISSLIFMHPNVFPYTEKMFWKDIDGGGTEILSANIKVATIPLVNIYIGTPGWADHSIKISAL